MRVITAGESHGEYLVAILEGFPKGVRIEEEFINKELRRRQKGVGRGARMQLEEDKVKIISGMRNKISLGSPIGILVKNKDFKIHPQKDDGLDPLVVPRPGHADLSGFFKYQEKDLRNILERASARETAARVVIGAICKQLLGNFNIKIKSFVIGVGRVYSHQKPKNVEEIERRTENSSLNCIDPEKEKLMIEEIEKAKKEGDTLGGVVEVWAEGVPPGLGSFMHFDRRLDAKLAYYLMSIPAVKGVEIGGGFEYAKKRGSHSHDEIYFSSQEGFYRKTNNAGGIEGGISNGEPIVVRVAMKPISTLITPLNSVNLLTGKKEKAAVVRSDVCAISACGVVAESMVAITLGESFLDKFGSDSLKEIEINYNNYMRSISNLMKEVKE